MSPRAPLSSRGLCSGGEPQIREIGRWRHCCVFLLLGGIVSGSAIVGRQVEGGLSAWFPRQLPHEWCMQFGNDDASSRVWVAAPASIVGFLACLIGSFVLCCVVLELELWWTLGVSPAYLSLETRHWESLWSMTTSAVVFLLAAHVCFMWMVRSPDGAHYG